MDGYRREKIWDPVTRLWHCALAATIVTGWTIGKFVSFDTIQWHFYLGYLTLILILIRVTWGLVGPEPIRFGTLFQNLLQIGLYLKTVGHKQPGGTPGHNPLGSLSVIAMLLVIAAQALTGLFATSEDFFEYGPLSEYVSEATSNDLTSWHRLVSKFVLILVGLHIAAILFYLLWKKENLIKPMISGWKWVKRE